jgi:hypothetical protein
MKKVRSPKNSKNIKKTSRKVKHHKPSLLLFFKKREKERARTFGYCSRNRGSSSIS